MITPTRAAVVQALAEQGYPIFRGGDYDLTLVVLRATPGTLDAFDDLFCALYTVGGVAKMDAWPCTADPGKPAIDHPTRRDGTAVIALGHQAGAYKVGQHHPGTAGAYPCLVPAKPIRVLRYASAADYEAGRGAASTSDNTQIHHAGLSHPSTIVGAWSNGCIVLSYAPHLEELLDLARLQSAHGHGSVFSLTVMEWHA